MRPLVLRLGLLLCLLCLLCARLGGAATLTILHTADLHGRVHPHDALADRDLGEGLARIAAAVRAIRASGGSVLLLDSGDTIQGSPTQALVFSGRAGDGSDPIVRAMNLAGYDAMAIGNHDFDFGLRRLEASRGEARFPWLSANTRKTDGTPAFAPYVVREVAGIRVGILGLVTPGVSNWESPALIAGLSFGDSVEAAGEYVPILRGQERCDLVVVLTHQGFETETAGGSVGASGDTENQASRIATEVAGVDLVLGGHAHAVISPRRLGGAWISEPGRFGNTLTRFDVDLEKSAAGWKVTAIRGRNQSMRRVAPDPEIVAAIEAEHEDALRVLGEPLARLETPVSAKGARRGDTAILDWVHAVQRREGKADLSFCSVLPVRLDDWPAGPLTTRQIWQLYPYENSLVTVAATGLEVREALDRAAGCFGDPRERLRNCDTLEGAEYAIDPRQPRGRRVLFLRRDGRDVRDDDALTVALNSYRASGGGGYPMWKRASRLRENGNIRDMLVADARARKRLKLEPTGNWRRVDRP